MAKKRSPSRKAKKATSKRRRSSSSSPSGRDRKTSRKPSKGKEGKGQRSRSRSKRGGGGRNKRSRSRDRRNDKKRGASSSSSSRGRSPSSTSKRPPRKRSGSRKKRASRSRSGKRKEDSSPGRRKKAPSDAGKRPSASAGRSSPSVKRDSKAGGKEAKEAKDGPKESAGKDSEKEAAPESPKEEPAPAAPVVMETTSITLTERPFGMAPSKEDGAEGYVVAKVADDKPAAQRGVKQGWRLVAVSGKPCKGLDLEAAQALLKNAELPVALEFEYPKEEDAEQPSPDDDDEDDDDDDDGLLDARADQRRSHADALSNMDDLPVKREPEDLPPPIKSWQDAVNRGILNKALMDKLQTAGLKRPTVIQRHAVPIIGHNSGQYDCIALAQTGSGKTFAFVIPTVARLVIQGAMPRPFFPGKSPGTPLLMVLSPTRELATQTHNEIETLAKGRNLSQVCIYGGETLKFQQQRIEKSQIDILCATPGRLIDLIDSNKISLSFVQSVILDEADQMMEQSLEVMCAEIFTGRDMPEPSSGRQTLLFSATMPQKIRELVPKMMRQHSIANITIGHYEDGQGGSCAGIRQILKWVPDENYRVHTVAADLKHHFMSVPDRKKSRVVIFTNQRVQAGILAANLQGHGFSCIHLHGKLEQHVREEMFDNFRRGQSDVLVATNVASRGLDFPDIGLVVQYNLPQTIDIYTHRIGRTGRAGQVGCALAYMGPKDRRLTAKLVEFLELNKQEVPDFLRPRSPPRGMMRRR